MANITKKETGQDAGSIARALADPFPADAIGWKPQTVSGNRCLAVAYIDARDVMDRLDDVMGPAGWQDHYQFLPSGLVLCTLRLHLGDDWIEKSDVGGESEQKDQGDRQKAAVSDALKRAAVKFGIGRYIYRLEHQWVDFDPKTKRIAKPPRLPVWALPGAKERPPVVPPQVEPEPMPQPMPEAIPARPIQKPPAVIDANQVTALRLFIRTTGADESKFCAHYNILAIEEMPSARFPEAWEALNRKKKAAKKKADPLLNEGKAIAEATGGQVVLDPIEEEERLAIQSEPRLAK